MKETDHTTIDDLNREFQDFQDELAIREKRLKFIPSFKDEDSLDKLLLLLQEEDHLNLLKEKGD